MVFLKLVHAEYQVNHKTQSFWVKVVHLVPKVQTLAGHAVGTIRTQDYRVHGEAFYLKLHVMISKDKLYLEATQRQHDTVFTAGYSK